MPVKRAAASLEDMPGGQSKIGNSDLFIRVTYSCVALVSTFFVCPCHKSSIYLPRILVLQYGKWNLHYCALSSQQVNSGQLHTQYVLGHAFIKRLLMMPLC